MRCLIDLLLVVHFLLTASVSGQPKLSYTDQERILKTASDLLKSNYVFPERLTGLDSLLAVEYTAEACQGLRNPEVFLDRLNSDLVRLTGDRHLRISISPKIVAQLRLDASGQKVAAPKKEYLQMLENENYRIRKAEVQEGNIGILKIDNFVELAICRETLIGALTFVSHSSAILLDFTDCGGGASATGDFIMSHFLPDSTPIGEMDFRRQSRREFFFTSREPGMKDLTRVPLFIAVSSRTASAAEGIAYTLQQYKRATIVGEQTAGKGNPGELFVVNDYLYMFITTAVGRNSVTGKSVDAVGVTPDIRTSADHILDGTLLEVNRLLASQSDDKKARQRYRWSMREYEGLMSAEAPPTDLVTAVVGQYEGDQAIVVIKGNLYFDNGKRKRKLTYLSDGTFAVDGRKDYRIAFARDDRPVRQMRVLWYDDTEDKYGRKK